MSYPAYPKHSATRWRETGNVPSEWEARRLKFAVTLRNEKIDAEGTDLEYMGLEHIESWTGKRIEDESASSEGIATRFVKDDVLFGKLRPYLAKVFLAEKEGMATTEALALVCDAVLVPAFLKYLLISDKFINAVSGTTYGAKMPRANWEAIGGLPILLPSRDEQQQIAAFLDWKTGQIDSLIGKKKELLEKLNEKRIAVITQAVTQGLNSAAPMRDTGIPWLGKVPEHWELKRLKWTVTGCFNGVWGDEPDDANDVVCVRVADFDRDKLKVSSESLTLRAVDPMQFEKKKLVKGDLLIEKSGGGEKQLVGCVVYFDHDFDAVCSNFVARMPVDTNHDARYWSYAHAGLYAGKVNYPAIKQTTGIQNLDAGEYLNNRIGYPPLEEQQQIAAFLDSETAKLDALFEKVNEVIARLTEYRAALITAATTGKIDVRKLKIPNHGE
jgi:type I restriction enzyme S subunit